ncbi:hypothetical protein [Luteolibacter sp. AS25]|uniref:hypothetical protein n=1 Tax=Luteolibacter sp. AS25 TaxID=3135776 RepID=UPI00398B7711
MSWLLTESDGLAIAMLATVLTSFGVIALLLGCMLRSSGKRNGEVDQLLEEMENEEKDGRAIKASFQRGEPREEWERDEDWWRKEE